MAVNSLILESIQNDVAMVAPQLKTIAQRVINEEISDFPLFVAAQSIIDIGRPIFDRDQIDLNWFFYATILEEFVHKGLISQVKLGEFRKTFGDPNETACIFVINGEEGHFVFVPYDIGEKNEEESE